MGLFPHLFHIPSADIIPNIVTLGGYGITKGSIKEGIKVGVPALKNLLGAFASPAPHKQVLPSQHPPSQYMPPGQGPTLPYNVQYGGGYGGGGAYDAWNYQPQQPIQYGGTPSWAYSTPSPTYSSQPWGTSSGDSSSRIWEDLAMTLPLLL